jgi:hypothetical protein
MSDPSTVAESIDSENVWKQLQRELEDVGISESVLQEKQKAITQWLKQAIENGLLEEESPDWRPSAPSLAGDSGYGSSLRSYVPSVYEMTTANKEFENRLAKAPSRTMSENSRASQQPIKVRKASTVSTMVFKLLKKDTEIIDAASDGDIARVAKLISRGANVNARDRWGVSYPFQTLCHLS